MVPDIDERSLQALPIFLLLWHLFGRSIGGLAGRLDQLVRSDARQMAVALVYKLMAELGPCPENEKP